MTRIGNHKYSLMVLAVLASTAAEAQGPPEHAKGGSGGGSWTTLQFTISDGVGIQSDGAGVYEDSQGCVWAVANNEADMRTVNPQLPDCEFLMRPDWRTVRISIPDNEWDLDGDSSAEAVEDVVARIRYGNLYASDPTADNALFWVVGVDLNGAGPEDDFVEYGNPSRSFQIGLPSPSLTVLGDQRFLSYDGEVDLCERVVLDPTKKRPKTVCEHRTVFDVDFQITIEPLD